MDGKWILGAPVYHCFAETTLGLASSNATPCFCRLSWGLDRPTAPCGDPEEGSCLAATSDFEDIE